MTWDQIHETEETKAEPAVGTDLTPFLGTLRRSGEHEFEESMTLGATELESKFTWQLSFHHPETLTIEEAREHLDVLLKRALHQQGPVLTRCFVMLGRVPKPVVSTVLDQWQDIAEYETRIWNYRVEHGGEPSIGSDVRMLPVGDE